MARLFPLYLLALLSSAFSIGGMANLCIRYRGKLLFRMLLFMISLFLVAAAFATGMYPGGFTGSDSLRWILGIVGGGINVAVLPGLVSSIYSAAIGPRLRALHFAWTALYLAIGLALFLVPGSRAIQIALFAMMIATILSCLLFMGLRLNTIRKTWWHPAIVRFFLLSSVFLVLLVLDMLLAFVDIPPLAFLDGLSVPLYLFALNIGIFLFSSRFLSRDSLMSGQKLSPSCVQFYSLSQRETEIVEALAGGQSTKEIAEGLFISPKTVENHLNKVYRKFDVGTRTQLLHELQNWRREEADR